MPHGVFRNSQKLRLLAEVEFLSEKLARPVSSRDLAALWHREPDRRPLLLQRIGQQLFKAARIRKTPTPRLHRIGILGNLAFYAVDDSPKWRDALSRHGTLVTLRRQARLQMPFHAVPLIGTPHDALARNALRGFLNEFEATVQSPGFKDFVEQTCWPEMIQAAREGAADSFAAIPPGDFVSRKMAASILGREYGKRYPFGVASRLSVGRHLVRLAWPQSALFKEKGYSRAQIVAYCASRWPLEQDDLLLSRAVFLCLAYGVPTACARRP